MSLTRTYCRWSTICLALWLTLSGTHAAAETIPPPDTGLALLLETRAQDGCLWPVARGELSEILARGVRLRAALADTVSALNAATRDSLATRNAREDQLLHDICWLELDLEHARANRLRWWQRPAVVVPVTVILTVLALDYSID